MTEKAQIYYNIWCCAYRRRHIAKLKQDWELYDREHQTVTMCLRTAKWIVFDSQKPKYLE